MFTKYVVLLLCVVIMSMYHGYAAQEILFSYTQATSNVAQLGTYCAPPCSASVLGTSATFFQPKGTMDFRVISRKNTFSSSSSTNLIQSDLFVYQGSKGSLTFFETTNASCSCSIIGFVQGNFTYRCCSHQPSVAVSTALPSLLQITSAYPVPVSNVGCNCPAPCTCSTTGSSNLITTTFYNYNPSVLA